jgi:hypothetical protein
VDGCLTHHRGQEETQGRRTGKGGGHGHSPEYSDVPTRIFRDVGCGERNIGKKEGECVWYTVQENAINQHEIRMMKELKARHLKRS